MIKQTELETIKDLEQEIKALQATYKNQIEILENRTKEGETCTKGKYHCFIVQVPKRKVAPYMAMCKEYISNFEDIKADKLASMPNLVTDKFTIQISI